MEVPRSLRHATVRARSLRRSATPAERNLWALLRDRRLDGAKFRRQQPLGPFVVDFFCRQARVVVEADGAFHFPPTKTQRARDRWLRAAGLTVLRFENREILHEPARVLERIRQAVRQAAPLSHRERGRG